MLKIRIKGLASGRELELEARTEDLEKDILSFLRSHSFPIASSCSGVGKCEKCAFNGGLLSCQKKVKEFIGKEVRFDYL